MQHWEFLLQKEGDRSWLPLDSPDVEILEGRYRIVARSSHSNAAIDIRIAHLATQEAPPKRRVQKRSCHTNPDGLMVVIPFTRLEPGLWELRCSPTDLLTDLMAGAQPYAVTLQVVARESEEDWDTDWSAPADDLMAVVSHASNDVREVTDSVKATHVLTEVALTEQAPIAATAPLQAPAAEIPPSPANNDRQSMPPEVAEILGASMDRLFQIAEQMSEQLVEEVLQDFDLNAIADASSPIEAIAIDAVTSSERAATTASNAPVAAVSSVPPRQLDYVSSTPDSPLAVGETFLLTLDQTAFVAARGEELTLSGQVVIVPQAAMQPFSDATPAPFNEPNIDPANVDPWDEAALNLTGASAQALQLCLRDPQSLQVLVSDRQPLPASGFPSSFTFSFSLPDTFSTHLALGEVLLYGSLADTEDSIVLTTQAFSITVDPTALVGELAKLNEVLTTEIENEERLDLPLELSSRLKEASLPLDLSFLNAAGVTSEERSPHFPSLAGQPLPPQLYRPASEPASAKPLDLPAFKLANQALQSAALQSKDATLEPPASDSIATTVAEAEISSIHSSDAAPTASVLAEAVPPETLDDPTSVVVPAEADAVALNQATDRADTLELPSPMQMAFQSLKLQDRFLTRLASLATDTELSALLKANLLPGSMPSSAMTAPSVADAPSVAETRSLTEEIVVDDEPQPKERHRNSPTTLASTVDDPPNPLVLPADDSVPMPTLEVPTGELIAGKPINIRVKLPNLLPRIYVKLWVVDRQTRSLLDGPRWLVDFLPNGLGDLEAMSPLTVPFGSVEIRLEAIAVEMHTQRESHKATVDRSVVPPDLPIVSLDDFND